MNALAQKVESAIKEKYIEYNNLAESIEKDYNLEMYSQPITDNKEQVMQELLLRTNKKSEKGEKIGPEAIVSEVREKNLSNKLVCFLLKNAYETYKINNLPSTINIEVSDVMHEDFLDSVDAFHEYYKDSINNGDYVIVFEILENEKLPENKQEREMFFSNLKALKEKGFKIAIDDFGGRDKSGNLLESDIERANEFIEEGVLDILKIDIETTREMYLTENENAIKIYSEILKGISEKGVKILAEGIEEDFTVTSPDGNEKDITVDVDNFMKKLKKVFAVTLFQGYALGKPENISLKTSEVVEYVGSNAAVVLLK